LLTIREGNKYYGDIRLIDGELRIEGTLGNDEPAFVGGLFANPGTTLEGFGDWERVVSVEGILSPGPGFATIKANELHLAETSTIRLEIAGPASFDKLIVTGAFGFAKSNLDLRLSYDPEDFVDSFMLFAAGSIDTSGGAGPPLFRYGGADLPEGAIFSVDSQQFRISYQAGDGNDIALFAVPEPTTPAVVALAMAYLLGAKRTRRVPLRGDFLSRPKHD
jgi:hypothetical protein